MYEVSEKYKLAVADSHRKSKMRAILTAGKTVIRLDDNDIIKNTAYITNQCTNGNEFEYGCVYSAECGISIKSDIDRYNLYDAKLELFWSLWTGEEWEEIPLGVFYVSEPNRINDKITIKALDGMTRLDVNIKDDFQGTMPQLLEYVAEECEIELSQNEDELKTFVNSDVIYSVQADKVKTYRDLIAYICMMSACFAIMDRYGKLKLVKYSIEPCVTLTAKQRYKDAKFSDYTTNFKGVQARFIAEENYAPYEEIVDDKSGIVLDMGDVPIVRGLPETKHEALKAVLEVLKDVSYTPFELKMIGNPAIDLGDMVTNEGVGKDNNTYISPITYYYWSYRTGSKLKSVGGNPKLAEVQSKQNKNMASLEGSIEGKKVVVKNFTNIDKITFSSSEIEICNLNYSVTDSGKILFMMTVRLNVSLDGLLVIQFYNNEAADNERCFKKYVNKGDQFFTITELYSVEQGDRNNLSIKAHMEYVESDVRKNNAQRQTIQNFLNALSETGATVNNNVVAFPSYDVVDIDTSIPNATIEKNGVNAVIYGQCISTGGKWDGAINISQEFGNVFYSGNMEVNKISDVVVVNTQLPNTQDIIEGISKISFTGGIKIGNFVGYSDLNEVIKDYRFITDYSSNYIYDKYITTNNDMFALKTQYEFSSTEQAIDSGKMCSLALDYSGINVESVVLKNE